MTVFEPRHDVGAAICHRQFDEARRGWGLTTLPGSIEEVAARELAGAVQGSGR